MAFVDEVTIVVARELTRAATPIEETKGDDELPKEKMASGEDGYHQNETTLRGGSSATDG